MMELLLMFVSDGGVVAVDVVHGVVCFCVVVFAVDDGVVLS